MPLNAAGGRPAAMQGEGAGAAGHKFALPLRRWVIFVKEPVEAGLYRRQRR